MPSTVSRERPARGAVSQNVRSVVSWAGLAVLLAGTFMSVLDFFIVNVAIPSIQGDLGAGAAAIEWVVAGYALANGVLLITAGRLGDLYGRRRIFAIGLAAFTVASLACGLASTAGALIAARIVQGVAASLIAPQVLAIIRAAVPSTAQPRAFSAYALTMGLAAVCGQLLGGLLIRADLFGLGWRSCFLINVPVGLVALFLVRRTVPHVRGAATDARRSLDGLGVLLITATVVAVVLPLIQGPSRGWPLWSYVMLLAAVPLLFAFVASQRRHGIGASRLVDLSIFRERAFNIGLVSQLVFWLGQASFFLVLALYLQRGHGLTPLAAGTVFVAVGVGYLITSITSHRLVARLGKQTVAVGGLVMAAGLVTLGLTVHRIGVLGSIGWIVPGLALDGLGMGMVLAPIVATILGRVPPALAGAASGLLSTVQQVGNAIGVAVIGIVFYRALGAEPAPLRFAVAFEQSVLVLATVGLILAVLVQFLPRVSPSDGHSGR